jgi:hypothetical protein
MRVIQEKETHASTPKNDEFNSVEGRQTTKGNTRIDPEERRI